jgi:hypothetical protein
MAGKNPPIKRKNSINFGKLKGKRKAKLWNINTF